jgi:phosphoadenosine phosphosulfate reductase
MHITMVKKRLRNNEPCAKCLQAEEMLRGRGLWERISEVVWAIEGDPESPGMALSRQLGVELAPFFIVRDDSGNQTVFTSTIKFVKDVLTAAPTAQPSEGAAGPAESVAAAALRLDDASPSEIVEFMLQRFGSACAISFSGAEDVVLIDLAARTGLPFSVFSLDTGRLHPETYRFIEKVRKHFGVEIEMFTPNSERLQPFVREKGLFSFYQDGHAECCAIRKVEPLGRALATRQAWITGQRKDQSVTRTDLQVIQEDPKFRGSSGLLLKSNPLANWTSQQVWDHIRANDLPYNELHDRGFVSIGCEPCTRAVGPGEHERAGRWWWEEETKRECGLHRK